MQGPSRKIARWQAKPSFNEQWFQHPSSKIIHAAPVHDPEATRISVCGRIMKSPFREVTEAAEWTYKCRICFAGRRQPVLTWCINSQGSCKDMPVSCQVKSTPVRCQLSCCRHSWHAQPKLVVLSLPSGTFTQLCTCCHGDSSHVVFLSVRSKLITKWNISLFPLDCGPRWRPLWTVRPTSPRGQLRWVSQMAHCSHSFAMVFLPWVGLLSLMANPGHRLMHLRPEFAGRPDVVSWWGSIEKAPSWRAHNGAESVEGGCGQPEAAHARKLPQVERNAKMVTLRAALPGVCIEKHGAEPWTAWLSVTTVWSTTAGIPLTWSLHITWVGGGYGKDFEADPVGYRPSGCKGKIWHTGSSCSYWDADLWGPTSKGNSLCFRRFAGLDSSWALHFPTVWTPSQRSSTRLREDIRPATIESGQGSMGKDHWRQCLGEA